MQKYRNVILNKEGLHTHLQLYSYCLVWPYLVFQ